MSEFGIDEEVKETKNKTKAKKEEVLELKPKRAPFALWIVGGEEYKLKLKTSEILQLEEKFKANLLLLIDGGMPQLGVMLTITQAALKSWHHGMTFGKVQAIFDQYCEEGGTQVTFYTDVIMDIFAVSGFFTESQAEDVQESLDEAREKM